MKVQVFLTIFLFALPACGVKKGPVSPIRLSPSPQLDCSIYDPECMVTDVRYDPACDPAKTPLSPLCKEWNKKYELARQQMRHRQLEAIRWSQANPGKAPPAEAESLPVEAEDIIP